MIFQDLTPQFLNFVRLEDMDVKKIGQEIIIAVSVKWLLFVLFLFLALPAVASAQWKIEAVDAPKYFEALSQRAIAIDEFNRPHIAYGWDHLYHAYFDGSQWK